MYAEKQTAMAWKTRTLIGSNVRERDQSSMDKKIMNVCKTIHIRLGNCSNIWRLISLNNITCHTNWKPKYTHLLGEHIKFSIWLQNVSAQHSHYWGVKDNSTRSTKSLTVHTITYQFSW